MGAQHNQTRYGERWPQYRIDTCLEELLAIRPYVVLSGGWAWHVMSPKGHEELKHAHDHKDIDLFVPPKNVATVVAILKERGFEKVWTKYDKLPSDEDFRRYEQRIECFDGDEIRSVKATIDFFVKEVSQRTVDGWQITEPSYLLSLYGNIHSSDKCFAVKAAIKLLEQGIDPVGRPELMEPYK